MRVVVLELALGLMLAAGCGGPPEHSTTSGGTSGTASSGSTGGTTTGGSSSGGTTGGCGTCRVGEICIAGQCSCDSLHCTGKLCCNSEGRCAYDSCRVSGLIEEGQSCQHNGDCGCPLFCFKDADAGPLGSCERRCNGTSDCPLPDTSCQDGLCLDNSCGGDAGNGVLNGPCNALGQDDGTCVPRARVVAGRTYVYGSCVQNGCATGSCLLGAKRTDGFALCAAGLACAGELPGPGSCYRMCDLDAGQPCPAGQTCTEGPPSNPALTLCLPFLFVDAGPTCIPPSLDGGVDAGPDWHEPFSLVPLNAGGVVLSALELTTIDYAGYDQDQAIQDYARWIVGSSWLSTVGHSYGVGLGTYVQHYTINSPAPSSLTGSDIDNLIESLLGVDGGLPAPNPNSLYIIYFPSSTTITGGGTSCVDYAGYHSEDVAGAYDVPYGVIPTCPDQDLSVVVSHELAEAATDPFVGSRPGYRFMNPSDAFTYVSQGEIGDLCYGLSGTYDGTHTAQRIWSNEEAQTGVGSPCAPVPPDEVFVDVTPLFTGIQPVSGGATTFLLTGWSNNPTAAGTWMISATTLGGTDTGPTLSSDTVGDGAHVALTVTFPPTAVSGDQTVVEVDSIEPVSGAKNYWPMIFQVQ